MRLVSFRQNSRPGFGALTGSAGEQVADLRAAWPSLKAAIAAGCTPAQFRDAVERAPVLDLADVELTIPVPDAERYVCAGLNFRAHAAEGGHQQAPEHPSVFLRSASTFVADGQPILRPDWSDSFDYEAELAVVIGTGGRHIAAEEAMAHVFGYTLLMDGSVREVQFKHSLTAGKNFFASGSMGPWVVTADEVADVRQLQLIGRVNGEVRQSAPISELIFDIPSLIAYWSRVDSLSPGDVLSVGTPSGVGWAMQPRQVLQVGDVVETEVPGVGLLRNPVALDRVRA